MTSNNFSTQIISRLMNEIRDLVRNPPDGIEYIENEDGDTINEIYAVISGPEETPFFGGKFKMKLVLPEDFPSSPPRGFFLTKIYHPNVALNGDICVNTLKRDWNSEVTMKHILQIIRCLLIVPFPESSLNDEAGKLFMDSYEEFARRARIMTQVHAMRSLDLDEGIHGNGNGNGENSGNAKKCSGDDDENSNLTSSSSRTFGEEENESTNISGVMTSSSSSSSSSASNKLQTQKRKAVDAKKKAMKRL